MLVNASTVHKAHWVNRFRWIMKIFISILWTFNPPGTNVLCCLWSSQPWFLLLSMTKVHNTRKTIRLVENMNYLKLTISKFLKKIIIYPYSKNYINVSRMRHVNEENFKTLWHKNSETGDGIQVTFKVEM